MEAFNYQTPALAELDEFREVFGFLYQRQLRELFGKDIFVVAAVEASAKIVKEEVDRFTEVLVALGHPEEIKVFKHRRETDLAEAESLVSFITGENPSSGIINFAQKVLQSSATLLEKAKAEYEVAEAIVAPYLVHSIHPAPNKKSYKELLRDWHQNPNRPVLLYSRPLHHCSGTEVSGFLNSYYSAVLSIYFRSGRVVSEDDLHWLEAFHISFQMAWGSPALLSLREKMDVEAERARIAEQTIARDARIQELARKVSGNVRKYADILGAEIDKLGFALAPPEKGLDLSELKELCNSHPSKPYIWERNDLKILPIHNISPRTDAASLQALISYGLLRVLGVDLTTDGKIETHADLRERARSEIENKTLSERLRNLLQAILDDDRKGFYLLRELSYAFNQPGREVQFYSLAARLLLSPNANDLTVKILSRDPHAPNVELRPDNFVAKAFDPAFETTGPVVSPTGLITQPYFPGLAGGILHREWFLPFVELIAYKLQKVGPADHVWISEVRMVDAEPCQILCYVQGDSPECVAKFFDSLESAELIGSGNHGAREYWMELRSLSFLKPTIQKNPPTLYFEIGTA
jgi:hypothetical protein